MKNINWPITILFHFCVVMIEASLVSFVIGITWAQGFVSALIIYGVTILVNLVLGL